MACALLPAAVAAAIPSPRRSDAVSKGQPNQVVYTSQLHWKLPLSESHRYRSLVVCCTYSGSSTETAISRRSEDVASVHLDESQTDSTVDDVLGARTVISGYWIGPDVEDGCGHVQAILQRIG